MTTLKKRINISVSDPVNKALMELSKRDEVPVATKVGELLKIALEIEEDFYFEKIASKRDPKDSIYIPHEEVWN
ncbi:hypothetical protein KJ603_00680 [Patescibacteria group bacterium]|nr:hypothetical protein [Patescibacteria group bacterium]